MFDTSDFDLAPYTDFDMDRLVQRTYCSWQDAGLRSLLVQRFTQVQAAEDLPLPGVRDLHLVLCTSGDTEMRIDAGGKPARRRWGAGLAARPPLPWARASTAATSQVSVMPYLGNRAIHPA